MIVKLLTEQYLEFLSLTGVCVYSCQNAPLLEITCHSSYFLESQFRSSVPPGSHMRHLKRSGLSSNDPRCW